MITIFEVSMEIESKIRYCSESMLDISSLHKHNGYNSTHPLNNKLNENLINEDVLNKTYIPILREI